MKLHNLFIAALLAVTVTAQSWFSQNRYLQVANRLHTKYGHGLKHIQNKVKLGQAFDDEDEVGGSGDPISGGGQPDKNDDGTQTYNGVTFDPKNPVSLPLGMVAGLQFNNKTFGRCFYLVLDTIDFAGYFQ